MSAIAPEMTALSKVSGRFVETDIDSEIVVMRLDNGEFFSLAGTAAEVWRLIDGLRDRNALISALVADFDADEATIAADVDGLLEQLREIELLACD
jgi:hypothetical protein